MSVDLQKLRQKLEMLKNPKLKTSKFDRKTWSPDKDKVKQIRLFEDPGSPDPFYELYFHYNVGKMPILCPRTNSGKDCPICQFAFDMKNTGGVSYDKETFKKLMPKQRFYGLMIDREDTTMSPKWWGFGKEIYQKLIEALLSEDYSSFMDPHTGLDAEIKVTIKTGGKTEYASPDLTFKRKESKLADDASKIQDIMNNITPLTEIYKPMTNVEIQEALQGWLKLDETDGVEVVKGGSPQPSAPSEGGEDVAYKDLDAAFQKALED